MDAVLNHKIIPYLNVTNLYNLMFVDSNYHRIIKPIFENRLENIKDVNSYLLDADIIAVKYYFLAPNIHLEFDGWNTASKNAVHSKDFNIVKLLIKKSHQHFTTGHCYAIYYVIEAITEEAIIMNNEQIIDHIMENYLENITLDYIICYAINHDNADMVHFIEKEIEKKNAWNCGTFGSIITSCTCEEKINWLQYFFNKFEIYMGRPIKIEDCGDSEFWIYKDRLPSSYDFFKKKGLLP